VAVLIVYYGNLGGILLSSSGTTSFAFFFGSLVVFHICIPIHICIPTTHQTANSRFTNWEREAKTPVQLATVSLVVLLISLIMVYWPTLGGLSIPVVLLVLWGVMSFLSLF
ncbi:hypothetical protein BC829DRAFT_382209, partial [Chytridium lagenaria]